MAIELKRKRNINWFPYTMGAIIILFAAAVVYFVLVQTPPLIEVIRPTLPEEAQRGNLARITLRPELVTESAIFQQLIANPVFLEPDEVGRANPFIPYEALLRAIEEKKAKEAAEAEAKKKQL